MTLDQVPMEPLGVPVRFDTPTYLLALSADISRRMQSLARLATPEMRHTLAAELQCVLNFVGVFEVQVVREAQYAAKALPKPKQPKRKHLMPFVGGRGLPAAKKPKLLTAGRAQ